MTSAKGLDLRMVNKDLVLTTKDPIHFDTLTGEDEIAQAISSSIQVRQGEDDIIPENGLPYDRMVGNFIRSYIEGQVARQIDRDPRVAEVKSIDSSLNPVTRKVEMIITVRLIDGRNLTIEEYFGV